MNSSRSNHLIHPNTETCPYNHATRAQTKSSAQQPRAARSPQEALSIGSPSGSISIKPSQHNKGLRNFFRACKQGLAFFEGMEARTSPKEKFYPIKVGPKTIYQVTDGELAQELMMKHPEALGRGDSLNAFRYIVDGENIFFGRDGEKALATRKIFQQTVNRQQENFDRINQVMERIFSSLQEGSRVDLYGGLVAQITIKCIAACFVGSDDLSALPADVHKTFMKATRAITEASMDPISRVFHPSVWPEFRAIHNAMANIAEKLLYSSIDNICKGNNYVWDLGLFRARQLHPEMNFDSCTHFEENNPQAKIVRHLIENDRYIREHGPLTIFASSNLGATLFYLLDVLSGRPDVVEKMRNEITRVLGDEPFTYEQLADLTYVRAVVREALWQSTPIPSFHREVLKDFDACIAGKPVSFKKGDLLMLLFRHMQGPPREFSPEVWLGSNNHLTPTLFAFGVGERRCPARPFAEQALSQFAVNLILHKLQFILTSDATYTTRNGLIGPDYQPERPLLAHIARL